MFSKEEKAAFELAEAMTQTPATVSEKIFDDLRNYFKEDQIVELVATIAMENYRARFNRAFLVESEGLYQPAT